MSAEILDTSKDPSSLELFGEVNQHAHVFPGQRAFGVAIEAVRIHMMDPEEHPDDPHAGSNVFVADLPKNTTQNDYADQVAKSIKITCDEKDVERAKLTKKEYKYNEIPMQFLKLKVRDITESEENLWVGLRAIAKYADETTRGIAIVLDEELNLLDENGEEVHKEDGEPLIDVLANERLAALRKALASTALITVNILPEGYVLDEPTPEEQFVYSGQSVEPAEISESKLFYTEPTSRTPSEAFCRTSKNSSMKRSDHTVRIASRVNQRSLF